MSVSDKAIAQAFRERLESMYSPLTVREVMKAVEARARELDAEKGGEEAERALANKDAMIYGTGFMLDGKRIEPGRLQMVFMQEPVHIMPARATPPAQAAEAVVVGLLADIDEWMGSPEMKSWHYLEGSAIHDDLLAFRHRITAAIAAMQAGGPWLTTSAARLMGERCSRRSTTCP